jgi:secretion/DNA translocation related CpaE-like protein
MWALSTDLAGPGTAGDRVSKLPDMDPRTGSDPTILVSTADPDLLDHALSVVAAAGLEAEVTSDLGSLRSRWSGASMLLIGVDQAAGIADLKLGRRAEVYVLAEVAAAPEAYQWSIPLGAAVVVVPDNARWLSGAIVELTRRPTGSGRMICVTGGSGGVGASTLAAALAFVAARQGDRSVLVDTDRRGGGLDLLVGAERVDGWRWPRLAGARGHLGELGERLPCVDGVDVLSMGRGEDAELGAEQLRAVLVSVRRSHDATVVDVSRDLGPDLLEAMSAGTAWLLVARDDIRGVAAGRERATELLDVGICPGLVVRRGRAGILDPQSVADGLGLELAGTLTDESGLALAAERGDPPGRSPRSALAHLARSLLQRFPRAVDAEPTAVPL